ncbi:hypothetical protein N431DRAFT_465150 [Stipitochalara longipes BDJ]|nr:hypothetical protein N431DRAFT_465150 [Stipitochalara longipes BDJ]
MHPSRPWELSPRCNVYDVNSVHGELNRIRRALCAVTRAYNQTKKELEDIKEATGFYEKAFPFLRLPREVRDQIYEYAFISQLFIRPGPRPIEHMGLHPLAYKPPTPELCLVNKQTHNEGVETLFGKNTFSFRTAGELVRFEEQIGSDNRNLVRSLDISTIFVPADFPVPSPDLVIPCDWQNTPTHWSKALMRSGLTGVVEMTITIENPHAAGGSLIIISPVLQQAIEEMLQRNTNGDLKRRLTLNRFSEFEEDKFPSDWDVRIERWVGESNEGCTGWHFD